VIIPTIQIPNEINKNKAKRRSLFKAEEREGKEDEGEEGEGEGRERNIGVAYFFLYTNTIIIYCLFFSFIYRKGKGTTVN
jgi:hypothetical protein